MKKDGKLFLPRKPSFDVATSAWLSDISNVSFSTGEEDNITFVSAVWDGSEMTDSDVSIGLNAPESKSGLSIRYGTDQARKFKSCFSTLLEEVMFRQARGDVDLKDKNLDVLLNLSYYINKVSSSSRSIWPKRIPGINFSPSTVDMNFLYSALRMDSKNDEQEMANLQSWFSTMDIYYEKLSTNALSDKFVESAHVMECNGIRIGKASDENGDTQSISRSLFHKKKVDVVIYRDGNHVGLIRSKKSTEPDLNILSGRIEEDGWYFYPQGTMASRGTKSRPIDTKSRYTIQEIEALLVQEIKNRGIHKSEFPGHAKSR